MALIQYATWKHICTQIIKIQDLDKKEFEGVAQMVRIFCLLYDNV
jgi:hypothetical protein